jgi:tRNA nucleotidyltransferase/poly(A) polymerase
MELTIDQFPQEIIEVCQRFSDHDYQAFVVGGSIRDLLHGEAYPSDWDIATDALPKKVISLFSDYKVIPTGLQHGTVTLLYNETSIEITTFRIESEYENGRRPSDVKFVKDISEDLSRRDLTINALAYSPIKQEIIDPFNGMEDLHNGIIKLVGNPDERLREDGLRLIRK